MKTIICDMSGIASIKGKNNELLLTTLQSLRNLQYTFCTGKGFLGACNTIKNNKLSLPIICENGALIIDESGNIVFSDIMDYVKSAKYIALTLEPLIAYLHAKETEIKTVRIIMTSKINDIDSDTIKERVREAYV